MKDRMYGVGIKWPSQAYFLIGMCKVGLVNSSWIKEPIKPLYTIYKILPENAHGSGSLIIVPQILLNFEDWIYHSWFLDIIIFFSISVLLLIFPSISLPFSFCSSSFYLSISLLFFSFSCLFFFIDISLGPLCYSLPLPPRLHPLSPPLAPTLFAYPSHSSSRIPSKFFPI